MTSTLLYILVILYLSSFSLGILFALLINKEMIRNGVPVAKNDKIPGILLFVGIALAVLLCARIEMAQPFALMFLAVQVIVCLIACYGYFSLKRDFRLSS